MGIFDWLFGKVEIREEDFSQELKDEIKKQETEDIFFSRQVNRNTKGSKYEKDGKIDLAIKLYEKNITENFGNSHPYSRLAIIHRKQKDYQNEIRVLNKAIDIFSNLISSSPRADIEPKLNKFKNRLEKAISLKH